jgi:hypothetical protein
MPRLTVQPPVPGRPLRPGLRPALSRLALKRRLGQRSRLALKHALQPRHTSKIMRLKSATFGITTDILTLRTYTPMANGWGMGAMMKHVTISTVPGSTDIFDWALAPAMCFTSKAETPDDSGSAEHTSASLRLTMVTAPIGYGTPTLS